MLAENLLLLRKQNRLTQEQVERHRAYLLQNSDCCLTAE